jgi:hypothetical protein
MNMHRLIAVSLLSASAAWAHPGHGGALGHLHGWDWGNLLLVGGAIAVGVALAIWKAK